MEIIKAHLSNPIIVMELLAFVFSLFTFLPGNEKTLRWFSVILCIICLAEFLAIYWLVYINKNNVFIYNFLEPIFTLGYAWIIRIFIKNTRYRSWIGNLSAVYFLVFCINMSIGQGLRNWDTYTILVGACFILATVCLAFIEISNYSYQVSLQRVPLFWISCAMLVYFFPSAVFTASYEVFTISPEFAKAYGSAYGFSQKILNAFHYGLLSYSFLCKLIFRV